MTQNQTAIPTEPAGGFTEIIGTSAYKVNVFFSTSSQEKLEDKIVRLIANEGLTTRENYVNMATLQAGRLPERGSL